MSEPGLSGIPPHSRSPSMSSDQTSSYRAESINMEWQNIIEAPLDGSEILLTDGKGVNIGWWEESKYTEDGEGGWIFLDQFSPDRLNYWINDYGPTHWMRLPRPPVG